MARPKKVALRKPPEEDAFGLFKVSQSKVKTYRRCRYAYHLRYVEKLRKKVKSRPLQFGTIVHKMLEAEAEGDDPFEALDEIQLKMGKMFAAERETYGDLVDDIRQIMTEYFSYWSEKDLRFERINKRSGEHEFEIELIPDTILWTGKIDAIGKTANKLRWIVEHKTFSRKVNDDERWRNLQSSTYIHAIRMLGWGDVDGMCWDYIRSKTPTKPSLLKDGSLSQKNIDTLPITIKETLAELKLKERDYKGFIQRSEEGLKEWMYRIHTPVDESVANAVFEDFKSDCVRMMEDHGKVKTKNIDRHCSWCDYEGICRAELQGLDVDYVKQKDYTYGREDDEDKATGSAD